MGISILIPEELLGPRGENELKRDGVRSPAPTVIAGEGTDLHENIKQQQLNVKPGLKEVGLAETGEAITWK
jgi:hypothetical protein